MAKQAKKIKPAVAFYDLTGCQGCLLSFLFNEDELLDIAGHVDIKSFRFFKGAREEKQFDIVFVEGLVTSSSDLETLNTLRQKAKVLVALGSCACTGCVPAYRNFIDVSKYAYLVQEKVNEIKDVPATAVNEHVTVDYYIPGCPPDTKQIYKFIKDILLGKKPYDYDRPVCFECRLNENRCLLDDGKMCLGPITRGGCDSVCTNAKLECWGCRGPTPDADVPLMIKLLEQKGFKKEHIKQRVRTFAGMVIERPAKLITAAPMKKPKKPKVKKPKVKKPKVKKPKAKKTSSKKKEHKRSYRPKKKTKKSSRKPKKNAVKPKRAAKKASKKTPVKKKRDSPNKNQKRASAARAKPSAKPKTAAKKGSSGGKSNALTPAKQLNKGSLFSKLKKTLKKK